MAMRLRNALAWCKTKLKQLGFLDWLIIISIIVFILVMFLLGSCYPSTSIECLLDTSTKKETLTFIGLGIGGLVLWKRAQSAEKHAEAMVKTTEHQAETNKITEIGHVQERLKTSIEHLGHEKVSVRIGAAHELYHLAANLEGYRETVCDILCSHIRQTTQETGYQKTYTNKPSEEIQTFLNLVCGRRKGYVFNSHQRDLASSYLKGASLDESYLRLAKLQEARLQGAELREAQLQGTNLWKARLQGANLLRAHLHGAILEGAWLQWAELQEAQLQVASLLGAQLQGASLLGAQLQEAGVEGVKLQGTILQEAQLQGANLAKAQLQGAILQEAQLQEANLTKAQLQGVISSDAHIHLTFQELIRSKIGQDNDFSHVTFSGGLSADRVERIVASTFPKMVNVKEKKLKSRLSGHIGQPPSNKLPENSGAITGKYSKEEAEQWIKEYDKAMESVPKKQPESDN